MEVASAEPVLPALPEMVAAALAQPPQPAPDAGLIGPDGTATLAAPTEPSPPPHPAVFAVVPMGEVGVPGTPMGVGADGAPEQTASVVPPRPRQEVPVETAAATRGEGIEGMIRAAIAAEVQRQFAVLNARLAMLERDLYLLEEDWADARPLIAAVRSFQAALRNSN